MRSPFRLPRTFFGKLVTRAMIAVLVMVTLLPAQASTLAAQAEATPIADDPAPPTVPEDEPPADPVPTEPSVPGNPLPDDPDTDTAVVSANTEPDATPPTDDADDPDALVPTPEDPAGTPETMMRTSASTMALDNGSVHITNYDQARSPLEGVEFQILQGGTVLDAKLTTNTGVLTIHSLPTEVDLVARQVTTPAGCDPVPDQPFRIEDGPPFQTRLTFVNACGGAVGSISVLVQDQSGTPLPGVQANARYFVDPNWSGIYDSTDSTGQVTLTPVYIGYDYGVVARGLPPGCMSPPAQEVTITTDALHHSLTFTSQCHDPATTGTLSIVKHDHNNVDMAGIDFEIYSGTMLVAQGTTNERGMLSIENIPSGSYIIRETNTPSGCIDSGDTPVDVPAGEDATVIRIENDCSGSSGEITVRVVDQYGTTLPGITFRIETGTRIHGRWTTDALGEATITPLTLNQSYEIIKEVGMCSGWGTEVAYLDEADPQMTVIVESYCTDAVPPPADLLLVKTDEFGNLLPGADFELLLDGTSIATGTTDANGEILFTGLTPGEEYDLRETAAPEGCIPGGDQVILVPADGSDVETNPVNVCDDDEGSTPTPTPTATSTPVVTPVVTPTGTPTPADPGETPSVTPTDPGGAPDPTLDSGSTPANSTGTDTGTIPGTSSNPGDPATTSTESGEDGRADGESATPDPGTTIRSLPSAGAAPVGSSHQLTAVILGILALCLVSGATAIVRRR